MSMAFLTDSDRKRIADAVRAAERKTSAEFVTVIARASDTYLLMPLLAAAAVALILPGVLWLAGVFWTFGSLYAVQLASFAVLALVFQWRPVAMRLVPAWIKRARAARRAREQFMLRALHRTRHHAGVLLFVSVAEHYVEIIADEGIHARVAPGTWDEVVAAFTRRVRAGRAADGFVEATERIADLLATHFPRDPDDRNELPDRLVELD